MKMATTVSDCIDIVEHAILQYHDQADSNSPPHSRVLATDAVRHIVKAVVRELRLEESKDEHG